MLPVEVTANPSPVESTSTPQFIPLVATPSELASCVRICKVTVAFSVATKRTKEKQKVWHGVSKLQEKKRTIYCINSI